MKLGDEGSSSSDTISYKTDVIREVAGKIIARVSTTLETHTSTWHTIQTYLDSDTKWKSSLFAPSNGHIVTMNGSMPDVYYYLRNALEVHEKRLHASFDWQLNLAQALFDLADQIDEAEETIKNGFRTPDASSSNGKGHNIV